MNITGPNPLNPYCYKTSAEPVETTESILQDQLKSTAAYEKKNDEVDEKQEEEIKKNQNSIKDVKRSINDLKNNVYTKEEVDEAIAGVSAGYVTEDSMNQAISEATNDMATKTWVGEQGYLTEHQSLAGLVASVSYVPADHMIYFYDKDGADVQASVDTTDFVKDGMIDNVAIVDGNLVITFNTESGKESISIPLTDIFNPENYYTKAQTDELLEEKADKSEIPSLDGYYTSAQVDEKLAETEAKFYTKEEIDAKFTESEAKFYLKEDVDAMMVSKANDIYNLTKIVGDMGGAVTYDVPNEAGKSLNTIMSSNSGTVKLTEDTTITRVGPGITAKNTIKLNLNGKTLTSTNAGTYGAIMARGTQVVTIGGSGTIEAGNGICIEANGADTVINLTGSTTNYHNNSEGELIYCYAGTINISNGVFRDDSPTNYLLNCYDANYRAGKANIIVTGGKFYDFNPADNSAEGEHTSFVPEGYTVTESQDGEHTVYTVKKAS